MKSKKILGYIFIAIAALLTLAIIGQLQSLLRAIFGFIKIFTGSLDANQAGNVIGQLSYWIVHFAITITLWVFGRKWTKFRATEK